MARNREWTVKELTTMQEMASMGFKQVEIAEAIGRTVDAVKTMRKYIKRGLNGRDKDNNYNSFSGGSCSRYAKD